MSGARPRSKTASLAASRAASDGWPLKLCFDPVLNVEGWQELYPAMLRETFRRIPAEQVQEVSFGVFRMNPDYLKKIQHMRPQASVIHRGIEPRSALSTYSDRSIADIRRTMEDELAKYMDAEKIFFVHG